MVIGFSGRIKSGKTTLSLELAKRLQFKRVSFGDYVKKRAEELNLAPGRESLQILGQSLVDNDIEKFCHDVLYQKGWNSVDGLIIDGIRHLKVLNTLKQLISPNPFVLIYIDTPEQVLFQRDILEGFTTNRHNYELHETEIQVQNEIKRSADLIIKYETDIYSITNDIMNKLNSTPRP